MYVRYMKRWLTWLKISDGHHTTPALSVSKNRSEKDMDYGLRTGYKIWTTDYCGKKGVNWF